MTMSIVRYAVMPLLLAALSCGSFSVCARTSATTETLSATNRNGSALKVRTVFDETTQTREVTVYFRPPLQQRMRVVSRFSHSIIGNPNAGLTFIIDWDRDGTHEISVSEGCGASPNCDFQIFNLNTSTGALIPFFKGRTESVRLIGGYLVDSARNNCCSWIYDFYRLSVDHRTVSTKPEFSGYVGADPMSTDPDTRENVCYFFKGEYDSKATRVLAPSKPVQTICRHYDE